MKAIAPEKIYLFKNPITETSDDRWLSQRSDENDIEYTRTDAFIDKACEWLKDNARNYYSAYATEDRLIEDFKKYMEL